MKRRFAAVVDRARIWLVAAYGRQRLVARAKRWLFARLATRLPGLGRPCIVRTSIQLGDTQLRLWVDAHSSVGLDAVMFGVYEPASMPRLLRLAQQLNAEQPTFVDVGANLGFYSIAFAFSRNGARVLACEPGPAAAALCERNVASVSGTLRTRGSSIELIRAAVTSQPGEALFTVSHDLGHSSLLEVENFQAGSITVRATTVAELCTERSISRVDVCKIDVEGAELDVIHGMAPLLQRGAVSLLQIEVNRPLWARSGRAPRDLVELLHEYGYSLPAEQSPLVGRTDWTIEDLIFLAPHLGALGGH